MNPSAIELLFAVLVQLSIFGGGGGTEEKYPKHCGDMCPELALAVVQAAESASELTGLDDVELLLAVGLHESKLNMQAVGKAGELGIWQLMPNSMWGTWASSMCDLHPQNGLVCLNAHAVAAAAYLKHGRRFCKTLRGTLAFYNRGRQHCDGVKPYVRSVLTLRARLRTNRLRGRVLHKDQQKKRNEPKQFRKGFRRRRGSRAV